MATKKEFEKIVKEIMEKPLGVFSEYSFELLKITKENDSIFYTFIHKAGETTFVYKIRFLNKLFINVSK